VVVHGVNGGAARAGYTAVYQRPALASIVGEEDFEVAGASQVVLLATHLPEREHAADECW
jgi:hypothetical protein